VIDSLYESITEGDSVVFVFLAGIPPAPPVTPYSECSSQGANPDGLAPDNLHSAENEKETTKHERVIIICIMTVREGQRTATIAQAMAHNVSTVERDMDMFEPLVKARGEQDKLVALNRAHENLKRAYADLLELFGELVAEEVMDPEGHVHEVVGSERTFTEEAKRDAELARKFETR